MKTLIKSLVVVLAMTACSTDDSRVTGNQNNIIATDPVLIGKGDLFGNGDEQIPQQNLVINNDAEWQALKLQMNSVNPCTNSFTETEVDFSQWTILATFDQIRSNGGHSIEIVEINESAEQINVAIETSAEGEVATTVMTQPFHIVKIPATNKPVVFE